MNNALSFLGLAKKAGRLEAGEAPAGAAAITALASTKKIRSQTDSRITRPICGLR